MSQSEVLEARKMTRRKKAVFSKVIIAIPASREATVKLNQFIIYINFSLAKPDTGLKIAISVKLPLSYIKSPPSAGSIEKKLIMPN